MIGKLNEEWILKFRKFRNSQILDCLIDHKYQKVVIYNKQSIINMYSQGSTYQDFFNKVKAKFKKQKQERKDFLRQITCKKLVESEDQSNDEEFLRKTGNKWWGRITRHYFPKIHQDHLDNVRQLTISEDITQFGSTVSPLLPFYQQIIYIPQDHIFLDDTIRIVYRLYDKLTQKQKHILAGYCLRQKSIGQHKYIGSQPCKQAQFYSFHSPITNQQKIYVQQQLLHVQQDCKGLELELIGCTQDQPYIYKCLQYENIWRNQNMTELEKEIQCWKMELEVQHRKNKKMWDIIQERWQQQKMQYPQYKGIAQRIQQLKKQLIHSQTFSYFRLGYSDKTTQDLSAAIKYAQQNTTQNEQSKYVKNHNLNLNLNLNSSNNNHQNNHNHNSHNNINSNNNNNRKINTTFFQTDCKVCFCTKNQLSNKVIYCDSCNTSFHQSCYGIEEVDEDKELICDVCVYVRKWEAQNRGVKCQLPTCQICGRSKFPIKNLDGHFYHISCLILFNFANIHEFTLTFKPGITHNKIIEQVIENEMDNDYCEYCIKNSYSGMKFKCSYTFCAKAFHPICAYLNGCVFQMKRKLESGGISVNVQCREHNNNSGFPQLVLQVYLRRYLCNYRHTVQIPQQKFKQIYEEELQKISKSARTSQFGEGGVKKILRLKKTKQISQNDRKKVQQLKRTQSVAGAGRTTHGKNARQTPKLKKIWTSKQKQRQNQFDG